MLELKNITKIYATDDFKQTALDNISIVFRKCEFVSILGPSGSGKTTLLNIIGGLDDYTDGDLTINGTSTKKYTDRDWDTYRNHRVGFVFQSYNLITHQSILSNVELALTLSGVGKKERRKRAIEALEKVGLKDHINKRPNQLSGGQMQRVAIARALVNNPDILLADEPTGALDSATSEQITDLLKEVAKDRLVIMVTHNAELAHEYSTRIIEVKDGIILNDSNKVSKEESELKRNKRDKKTNMSMKTALSLSLNNLMTKKGRTILTAFAGSIGIIGIALILSLSNGINSYIAKTEEETLSSYPLTIQKQNVDMASLLSAFSGSKKDNDKTKSDEIASTNIMGDVFTTLSKDTKTNDMKKFMSYVDKNNDIKKYTSDIKYSYEVQLNLYKDTSDKIVKVNPTTVYDSIGMSTSNISSVYSSMMSNNNVFTEMLDNESLNKQQYDLVAGKWPKKYNELVLIVDKNNHISDYTLYSIGLLDQDDLKEQFNKMVSGEKVSFEKTSYKISDILNLKFRLVKNSDYYQKENGMWLDKSDDEEYMKNLISNAEELKVVGIIKPNEEAVNGASTYGMVGYQHSLMTHLIKENESSDIVKEQVENKNQNIFTRSNFQTNKKFDMNSLSDEQKMSLASMSQEEMATYIETYTENMSATYEDNLKKLGSVSLDNPDYIYLYPKDFDSKESIVKIIDKYNDGKEEKDQIQYTDVVGVMMSSVTTIVNVISSVLIAFVAISLVVSSIMIAIITYISVIERTKEIGILRAIGASKKDISRVFNAETLIEGLSAGILGIVVTLLLNIPINIIIKNVVGISNIASLPVVGAIVLIIISVLLTVIAGFIPAKIASKKDPVEALRSE